MNVGYNQNQALLAGAPLPYMPYSPSYSVPIQSQPGGPGPLPQQPMRVDSFESTRDKSVGDFVGGFFTGAGKAIYDMGRGLFFIGGVAGTAIKHPIKTVQKVGGAVVHGVTHPLQTAETVVTLPFKVARGIVKPYSQALEQGKYGEAVGRLAVDVTVITAAFGGKQNPGNPPPGNGGPAPVAPASPPPATPVTAAPPVGGGSAAGGASANVGTSLGDTILEKIGSVENIVGNGNTINVNIGNINVGGATMQGSVSSVGGGAGGLSSAGTMIDDLGQAASKVVSGADELGAAANAAANTAAGSGTAAQAGQTVGTMGNMGAHSSTIGMKIGGGIDFIIGAPGKTLDAVGRGIQSVGRGLQKVGNVILNPLDSLKGLNPVQTAEWIANGIRAGGNGLANGIVFAAHNPGQAMIVAGAVGRGGKAAEDILMEMDLVR